MTAEGLSASSISTRISDVRRLENHFGDLDAAFEQDRLASIFDRLTYTTADQNAGRPNPSGLEIDGDLYNGLSGYKSSLTAYLNFRDGRSNRQERTQVDRIRQYVADHYADPARSRGETHFTVRSGDIHNEMGLSQAMPAVCSALDSSKFAALIGGSLSSRRGPANSSTVQFLFTLDEQSPFGIAEAEAELRRRYGNPVPTVKPEGNKYVASFALADERQIALELEGQSVRIWMESDGESRPPDEPNIEFYEAERGRQANLPSRLKHEPPGGEDPRPVIKLSLPTRASFMAALAWYELLELDISMLTREAVLETLDEFDRTTLDEFLDEHGFGPPRSYWIAERGKFYPCKAITNVALRKLGADQAEVIDATRSRNMVTRLGFQVVDELAEAQPRAGRQPLASAAEPKPTNLILYGPPGTGKTFHTAEEAVRICNGEVPSTRKEIFLQYEALRKAGQIDFVTFHQSYAYEDFVEGLRPVTGNDESDEETPSAGFRLEPKAGIFRDICALAEQSRKAVGQSRGFDLSGRQIFKMSLGRAGSEDHIYDAGIEGGYIVLGWGGEVDWSDPKYDQYQAIHDKWNEIEPGTNGNDGNISQIWRFRTSMKPGDLVIVSAGNSNFRAIGEIAGPYEYQPTDVREYNHRRSVRWLLVLEEPLPVETIHDGKFTMRSCYLLKQSRMKLEALSRLLPGSEAPAKERTDQFVLIIDEINRANISKVFGELITLIEDDKRIGRANALTVKLPYSGDSFGVPDNLHIIGTMNTADRSIALLDTALRRRFKFRELMPDPSVLDKASAQTGINLVAVLRTINERIEYLFDREHQIGHAYFINCDRIEDVHDTMRDRVIPLLAEYFYEDWSKVALVLGDADGAGRFVRRDKLTAPAGMQSDSFGEDRYRWTVRDEFDDSAYDHFG